MKVRIAVVMVFFSVITMAAVSQTIQYQGKLTDITGVGENDTLDMRFNLYDVETAGDSIWTATVTDVPIVHGLFDVDLGPIDLTFDQQYWLEIIVADNVLAPRIKLASSPYAFRAAIADSVAGGGSGADADWTIAGVNMYAAPSGNVGIGTASPMNKLQVEAGADTAIYATGSDDAVGYFNNTAISSDKFAVYGECANTPGYGIGGWFIGGWTGVGGEASMTGSANNMAIRGAAANGDNNYGVNVYAVSASGTNAYGIYTQASGAGTNWAAYFDHGDVYIRDNLGVGTTTPRSKLHIEAYDSTDETDNGVFVSISNTCDDSSAISGVRFKTRANTDDLFYKSAIAFQRTTPQGRGNILFLNNDRANNTNADISDVKMTITRTGDVGIGTMTPQAKLDVAGITRTSNFTMPTGAGDGYILKSDASGNASWASPTSISDGDWTVSGDDMYSAVSGNVGIGTDTPTALLHTNGTGTGEGNVLFVGEYKDTSPGDTPVEGAGTRMMWYPDKAAFRAGKVNGVKWDKDSIGVYSVAMGWDSKASGHASIAMGEKSTASGYCSIAIGEECKATALQSVAIGAFSEATGRGAVALGVQTRAPSKFEFVVGCNNTIYTPGADNDWIPTDRLFVIGNGMTPEARSNAMTVLKNGNVGIGTSTPTDLLHISGADASGLTISGAASHNAPTITLDNPDNNLVTKIRTQDGYAFNVAYGSQNYLDIDTLGRTTVRKGLGTQNGMVRRDFIAWNTDLINDAPIHIKTNISRGSEVMYRFLVEGYNYMDGKIINSDIAGQAYDATSPIHAQKHDYSNGVTISQYYSSDDFLVIKLTQTSSGGILGFSVSAWFVNTTGTAFNVSAEVFQQSSDL